MYYPLQNMCMTAVSNTDQRDPSKVYGLTTKYVMSPGADKVGTVWAISAESAVSSSARSARARSDSSWAAAVRRTIRSKDQRTARPAVARALGLVPRAKLLGLVLNDSRATSR